MADAAAEPPPAPWDKTLESWNPITVVVLAALGGVAAVALLLVGARATTVSASFVDSPGFATWAAVLAAQSAFWAVVTVPLWREVRALYRATDPGLSIWVIPGLIVAALALLALFSPAREAPWPLVGHQIKAWVLTTAAAAGVGVPAIFGICLVQDRVRRHRPDTMATGDVDVALSARAQIRRYLGTAGAVIGLAVLASGALRLATVPEYLDESAFPATAVLLYGAFFTGLLVLVYVPAHLSLRRFCVDIREHYFPVSDMPPPTREDFAGWVESRARLDTLTQVNVTTGQQLQAGLFILAPLVSGILGALVPQAA
jgi:hypothetical protein